MPLDTTPVTIPSEKTTISHCATLAGTYVALGSEVTAITPPGIEMTEVPTWGLGSACKTTRPGLIPDFGEVTITLYADPNFAAHTDIAAAAASGAVWYWKITYFDGKTTSATDVFQAWIKQIKPSEDNEEKNLEWEITLRVTSPVTRTAGS